VVNSILWIKFNLAWKCEIFLELRIRVLKHNLGEMQDCQKLDQLECCKLPWMWNCVMTTKKKGSRWSTTMRKNERRRTYDFPYLIIHDVLL